MPGGANGLNRLLERRSSGSLEGSKLRRLLSRRSGRTSKRELSDDKVWGTNRTSPGAHEWEIGPAKR